MASPDSAREQLTTLSNISLSLTEEGHTSVLLSESGVESTKLFFSYLEETDGALVELGWRVIQNAL